MNKMVLIIRANKSRKFFTAIKNPTVFAVGLFSSQGRLNLVVNLTAFFYKLNGFFLHALGQRFFFINA